jgi:prepilin peptidase CpaA
MNGVPFPVGPCVLALVVIAALWDVQTRRIPNWLVALGLVVALPVQWMIYGGMTGTQMWLGGCLTGGAVFLPGYLLRMLGAGDVKLMAAVGAFCGASGAVEIALVVCVVGGAWALVELLRRRQMKTGLQNMAAVLIDVAHPSSKGTEQKTTTAKRVTAGTLPYGVAIAMGTTLVLFASN